MICFIFTKFNIIFIWPDLVWFTEPMLNIIMVECGQTRKPVRIFWVDVTMRWTQSFKSEDEIHSLLIQQSSWWHSYAGDLNLMKNVPHSCWFSFFVRKLSKWLVHSGCATKSSISSIVSMSWSWSNCLWSLWHWASIVASVVTDSIHLFNVHLELIISASILAHSVPFSVNQSLFWERFLGIGWNRFCFRLECW